MLVVSAEPVGARMAGPAIRALGACAGASGACDVTVAAPGAEHLADPRLELVEAGMADVEALVAAAREHDIVVAQELPPVVLARIALGPRLVADLYNPHRHRGARGGRAPTPRPGGGSAGRARTMALCAAADLICARTSASATSGSAGSRCTG